MFDGKKIKILGHEYILRQKDAYIVESGGNTGQCNNYLQVITIANELPLSGQHEVLIHEVIEALNYRLELGLEHHKIAVLGEALHQVIWDNDIFK